MYKLTVVAGPNRGTSYAIKDGELSIGRQGGNGVVLSSPRVSKKHCVLVASNGELVVRDNGSANGTFVNGVLSKEKVVGPGDRISVGEFVLEVSVPPRRSQESAPPVLGMGSQVLQFPIQPGAIQAHPAIQGQGAPAFGGADPLSMASDPNVPPQDLKGRLIWRFEHKLMPFFYGLNIKHEWRVLGLALFGAFLCGNLLFSVQPILNSSRVAIIKESQRRAGLMARQLAERNSGFIAAGTETKTTIGNMDREDGVRLAVIVDMDSRIIAPGSRMNEYLTRGEEAKVAVAARNLFTKGKTEKGFALADEENVVAVEPIKAYSAQSGKNEIVGMAVVSIDPSLATLQMGEMGMIYAEALIWTGLLAALVFAIWYRLTLRPLQILNDDIDKVLKGDMMEVTHEYKMEELDPLWDIINSALQRVPKGGPMGDGGLGGLDISQGPSLEDFLGTFRMWGNLGPIAVAACDSDRKLVYANEKFEEVTGIRPDSSLGQELSSLARDQAFSSLITDLFDRSSSGSEGVSEDFDFSGISFKVSATAVGPAGGAPKGYVLTAVRNEY